MTAPTRRLVRRTAPLLVAILMVAGCSVIGGNDDGLTITAEFDDVLDLVTAAHVRAGDVPIGTVTDIELTDGFRARVTMSVEADTGLPAETEAVLAKTSLLGERYIDLRPIGDSGSLQDGQHLDQTRVVSDFEDIVRQGNDVLAFVAADRLAAAVQTGATAFGGRGSLIGQFITDIETFVGRYDEGQDDLLRLIDELDGLTAELAPNAEANAEGFAILEETSQALEDEDDRLLDALDEVRRLSVVGERIMREHRAEIDNGIRRLRIVLASLTEVDGALQNLLTWAPRHNIHVPNGVTDEFAQVWLDFLVCDVNDAQGDPSRDCTPPNPGEHADPPPYHPTDEACWEDHANCEGQQRDERGDG